MGTPSAQLPAAGTSVRGQAKRHDILEAALALVGDAGAAAVTHRAVAARAGVPTGSIAYYFGTVDGLLDAALRHFVEQEAARLRTATAGLARTGAQTDRAEVVAAVLDAIGLTTDEQLAQFELYLEAARRPALRDAATDCLAGFHALAEEALGQLGAQRPAEGARALVALLDGLGLHRTLSTSASFDRDVALPAVLALVSAYAPEARSGPVPG